jgi:hypothetical protein
LKAALHWPGQLPGSKYELCLSENVGLFLTVAALSFPGSFFLHHCGVAIGPICNHSPATRQAGEDDGSGFAQADLARRLREVVSLSELLAQSLAVTTLGEAEETKP